MNFNILELNEREDAILFSNPITFSFATDTGPGTCPSCDACGSTGDSQPRVNGTCPDGGGWGCCGGNTGCCCRESICCTCNTTTGCCELKPPVKSSGDACQYDCECFSGFCDGNLCA